MKTSLSNWPSRWRPRSRSRCARARPRCNEGQGQRFRARPAPPASSGWRSVFFCGPDEAGSSAAANRVAAALPDAGERIELTGADLRRDPALLGDEARSNSLFGGKRHIFVRASGDEAHDALQILIETSEAGPARPRRCWWWRPLPPTSRAPPSCWKSGKTRWCRCFYPPDLSTVAGAVRTMADAAGLRLGGDLAERIARGAGLDVRLAQSRSHQACASIATPTRNRPNRRPPRITPRSAPPPRRTGFAPLVNAVLGGELGRISWRDQADPRARAQSGRPGAGAGTDARPQLAQITAQLGPRGFVSDRLDKGQKARLGIFFKEERDIRQQYDRWRMPAQRGAIVTRLDRLIPRLAELHRTLLANSQAAELLLTQELAEIARYAAKR